MSGRSGKRLIPCEDETLASDDACSDKSEAPRNRPKRRKTIASHDNRDLGIGPSQIHPTTSSILSFNDDYSQTKQSHRHASSQSRSQRSSRVSSSKSSNASGKGPLSSVSSAPSRSSEYDSPALGGRYIWGKEKRCAKCVPKPGHEPVLANAIPNIQATLVTGYHSGGCTPWADIQQKGQLSELIGKTWSRLAKSLGTVPGQRDHNVSKHPLPHEARKIYDAVGEIRGYMMQKARDTVRSHYTFSGGYGEYVQKLLRNKAFLSVNINDPKLPKLFLSDVVSKTIAQLFFFNDRGSLGTNQATKHMFNPLTSELIILVATMIGHAISEYRHGSRQVIKFEGQVIKKSHKEIRTLWFSQSAERQEKVKNALRNIVIQISGTKEELADVEVVNYAFKDSLADLDDLDCTADYAGLPRGGGCGLDVDPRDRGGREALVSSLTTTQMDDVASLETLAGAVDSTSKGGTNTTQRGADVKEAEKRDGSGNGMDDMTPPISTVVEDVDVADGEDVYAL